MSSLTNRFLTGPLGPLYLKTALPIIFVMGMNGLLTVVDALFLGHFAGPEALAAVTLMFPPYMIVVSLATLVSSGMSSILARHLGAWRLDESRAIFAGAHGLALCASAALIALFLAFGKAATELAAGGSENLAELGWIYLRITVFASPLAFVLAINSDALRNEGLVAFMAGLSLLVSVSNMGFNYVLIGLWGMGVAGSAFGTALAQTLAIGIVIVFRVFGETGLRPLALVQNSLLSGWGRILALGAPASLNFLGFALGSAAIIACLQRVDLEDYEATVTAYGIITRVITFTFLPLLGLSHAMQTITGNNFGAGLSARCGTSLQTALWVSALYCGVVQVGVSLYAQTIGAAFTSDTRVVAEVGRILPVLAAMFVLSGPLMMVARHFQSIGDAGRAALLGLSKPYLFAIPLTFVLAETVGEFGIWLAGPLAEGLLLVLTVIVLTRLAKARSLRWGLFPSLMEAQA